MVRSHVKLFRLILHSTFYELTLLKIIKLEDIWIMCSGQLGTNSYHMYSQVYYFEEDKIHWNLTMFFSDALGIFPTQGSNLGLQHCGQMLYHLSHQGILLVCRRNPKMRVIAKWLNLLFFFPRVNWLPQQVIIHCSSVLGKGSY